MIKRFLLAVFLLGSAASFSQESTSSPYSFFGLGDTRFKGTVETRSMGGLSIFSDSIHINLQNPAFYPHLKLTSFTIGGSHTITNLKTNFEEENARRTSLDYLAVAFPIGKKLGAGFGLMPYTAVGYKLRTVSDVDGLDYTRQATGEGGLNKVFFGAGYRITDEITFGAEFQYFFGNVHTRTLATLEGVQYGSRETNESSASGFGLNTGLSYSGKVGSKLTLSAAAAFSTQNKISFSNERQLAIVQPVNSGFVIINTEDLDVPDSEVKMPSRISFGAGIGEAKKWMVGAEAEFRNSSDMGNRFQDITEARFEKSEKFIVGGYYIPNYASFGKYFNRVTYRGGFRYENTGLVLNEKTVKDVSGTIGFGLPLAGTFSNINIGIEYGKRGTRDAGLVEENYLNFTVGLSFNDRWFVRRKYD